MRVESEKIMEEKTMYHCENMTARVAGFVLIIPVAAAAAIGFGVAEGVRAIKRNIRAEKLLKKEGVAAVYEAVDPKLVKVIERKIKKRKMDDDILDDMNDGEFEEFFNDDESSETTDPEVDNATTPTDAAATTTPEDKKDGE